MSDIVCQKEVQKIERFCSVHITLVNKDICYRQRTLEWGNLGMSIIHYTKLKSA